MDYKSLIAWSLLQLHWLLFIRFFTNQQIPMLLGYRKWVPSTDRSEDGFHLWGAITSVWVGLLCLAVAFVFCRWYGLLFLPVLVAEYFAHYDLWINQGLGNDINYLGKQSWWDQFFLDHLGNSAGKKKRQIANIVSIVCDAVFIFLFILHQL
jgi:hypothetical protein